MTAATRGARWRADVTPVGAFGATMAAVAFAGALAAGHPRFRWVADGAFDSLSAAQRCAIAALLGATILWACAFPRIGGFLALSAFSFQRVFQNLQTPEPSLLVLCAWTGAFLVGVWDVQRPRRARAPIPPRLRALRLLFLDGLLAWLTLHCLILGPLLATDRYLHLSGGVGFWRDAGLSGAVGVLLFAFALVMLAIGDASALYAASVLGLAVRIAQGVQIRNAYIVLLWCAALLVATWAWYRDTHGGRDGDGARTD